MSGLLKQPKRVVSGQSVGWQGHLYHAHATPHHASHALGEKKKTERKKENFMFGSIRNEIEKKYIYILYNIINSHLEHIGGHMPIPAVAHDFLP